MADPPTVSVIVPAYRPNAALLRECITAVLGQDLEQAHEVIVVISVDEGEAVPAIDIDDPRLTIVGQRSRLSAAAARNRGVDCARGRYLAFTDATARPHATWVRSLLDATAGGSRVAAGAITNANPGSRAATVEYLVEFVDLHPRRPAPGAWHGAACNLMISRPLWERYGPWPDLGGGEDTLLTTRARRAGQFCFDPTAVVERTGRTTMRAVVRHQYAIGRYVAHVGRRGPHRLRPLVRYSPLAPLAFVGRVASVLARSAAWSDTRPRRLLTLTPSVVVALAAWSAGLFVEGARLDRDRLMLRRPGAPAPPRP